MRKWIDPFTKNFHNDSCPNEIKRFFEKGWIEPGHGIALTDNGSMTMEVLVADVKDFVKHARAVVPDPSKTILFLLDGHK